MTKQELTDLILQYYRNAYPSQELDEDSYFVTNFVEPLASRLAVDTEDVRQLIIDRLKAEFPDLAIDRPGSVASDVLAKAVSVIVTPILQTVKTLRQERAGFANPSQVSREALADLARSFFVGISDSTFAQVVVRFEFSEPTDVAITADIAAYTVDGRRFLPVFVGMYSASNQSDLGNFYADVLYQAEFPGSDYNIGAEEIVRVDSLVPNLVRVYNPEPATPAVEGDDKDAIVNKVLKAVSQHTLASESGIVAVLAENFPEITSVHVAGYGDRYQLRDSTAVKASLKLAKPSEPIKIVQATVERSTTAIAFVPKSWTVSIPKTELNEPPQVGYFLATGGVDREIDHVLEFHDEYLVKLTDGTDLLEARGHAVHDSMLLDSYKVAIDSPLYGSSDSIIFDDIFYCLYLTTGVQLGPFKIVDTASGNLILAGRPTIIAQGTATASQDGLSADFYGIISYSNFENVYFIFKQQNHSKPQWFQVPSYAVDVSYADGKSTIKIVDFSLTDGFEADSDVRSQVASLEANQTYDLLVASINTDQLIPLSGRDSEPAQSFAFCVFRSIFGYEGYDKLLDYDPQNPQTVYADYRRTKSSVDLATSLEFMGRSIAASDEVHVGGKVDLFVSTRQTPTTKTLKLENISIQDEYSVEVLVTGEKGSDVVQISSRLPKEVLGHPNLFLYTGGTFFPISRVDGVTVYLMYPLTLDLSNDVGYIVFVGSVDLTNPHVVKFYGSGASSQFSNRILSFPFSSSVLNQAKLKLITQGDTLRILNGKCAGIYEVVGLVRDGILLDRSLPASESGINFEVLHNPQTAIDLPVADVTNVLDSGGNKVPEAFPLGITALSDSSLGIAKLRAYFKDRTAMILPMATAIDSNDGTRLFPLINADEYDSLHSAERFGVSPLLSDYATISFYGIPSSTPTLAEAVVTLNSAVSSQYLSIPNTYLVVHSKVLVSSTFSTSDTFNLGGKIFRLIIDGVTFTHRFSSAAPLSAQSVVSQLQEVFDGVDFGVHTEGTTQNFLILSKKSVVVGDGTANVVLGFAEGASNEIGYSEATVFTISKAVDSRTVRCRSLLPLSSVKASNLYDSNTFFYVSFGLFPGVAAFPANLTKDSDTGLYYFDFMAASTEWWDKVSSVGSLDQLANVPDSFGDVRQNTTFKLVGAISSKDDPNPDLDLLPAFGYYLKPADPSNSFSARESLVLRVSPMYFSSNAPALGPSRFLLEPITVEYLHATKLDEIQDFVASADSRIVMSDYLVRSKVPVRVLAVLKYSGAMSEAEVVEALQRYFASNFDIEILDTSDIKNFVGGSLNYSDPTALYVLTQTLRRERLIHVVYDNYDREVYERFMLHPNTKVQQQ